MIQVKERFSIERPSDYHIKIIGGEYVQCYGSDGFRGHPIWKKGDLYLLKDGETLAGWICAYHWFNKNHMEAYDGAMWRRVRDGY